jgi:hypothetical protein
MPLFNLDTISIKKTGKFDSILMHDKLAGYILVDAVNGITQSCKKLFP